MFKTVAIATIVAIFCIIISAEIVHGQITEADSKARKNLLDSLSSPKISTTLKNRFLQNEKSLEEERVNIMIQFTSENLKAIRQFEADSESGVFKATATRGERISNLVERLEDNAASSQKEVIDFLEAQEFEFQSLWLENEIYVKQADAKLVTEIARKFRNVAVVRLVGRVKIPKLEKAESHHHVADSKSNGGGDGDNKNAPWYINQVGARCSDIKCLGEGVVIAIIDGSVYGNHSELIDNFRGEYSWYDPAENTTWPTVVPSSSDDEPFHGTWVAGLAVGRTVGVAPGAKWMACNAFRINFDEEFYLKACGEWALCPFEIVNGTKQKDCSKAPNIINNSWGDYYTEELTHPYDYFYSTVAAWVAAGIVPVFSAGNYGPSCSTIGAPNAYDNVFTVGAVSSSNSISYFSSRGPVLNLPPASNVSATCKKHCGSPQLGFPAASLLGNINNYNSVCTITKPNIAAPGVALNSSVIDSPTAYGVYSGTSGSSPIVAGMIALILCANNNRHGEPPKNNIGKVEVNFVLDLIKRTANTKNINLMNGTNVTTSVNFARNSHLLCDLAFSNKCDFPNNLYGHGVVNACEAVRKIKPGSVPPLPSQTTLTTVRPSWSLLGKPNKPVILQESQLALTSPTLLSINNPISSLNSPKISSDLRHRFLKNHQNGKVEREEIMIVFKGGNAKALREFNEDSTSGKINKATTATATRGERINRLVERLERNSAASQKKVISFLKSKKKSHQVLWVTNEIFVSDADVNLVAEIAEKFGENVEMMRPIAKIKAYKPTQKSVHLPNVVKNPQKPDNKVPWNIEKIQGRCSNIRCLGNDIVVAILDNGVLWEHEQLVANYRNDDFSWFDPTLQEQFPSPDNGTNGFQGTAVAAIAVGKTVGVAPNAKWIACRATGQSGTEVTNKICGQWALCPNHWNDTNTRNCSAAPHVINCSWGNKATQLFQTAEDFYYGIVAAWNAAGIASAWMAGDEGPYCSSLRVPASYDISFSVGSVDERSNIQVTSSRGPVLNLTHHIVAQQSQTITNNPFGLPSPLPEHVSCKNYYCKSAASTPVCTITKPDISAPGVNILSANITNNNDYALQSGSAFSTPVVTGTIALLLCANNQAHHGARPLEVSDVFYTLKRTAKISDINLTDGNNINATVNFARKSHLMCDLVSGDKCGYPNNVYGNGIVNACKAVAKIQQ